jgi:hypothetical protein
MAIEAATQAKVGSSSARLKTVVSVKWAPVRYRRRGLPFFFKDQREGARFAERINARPKGDPNQEAGSLSVRDFAREAQEHADIWRRAGR